MTAPVWSGNCHFPDFTSARVRAWWGSHLSALTQAGFAGIWDDKNEPAVIALRRWPSLPVCVTYDWDGAGKTHIQGGNNVYGMQMARATRDGLLKLRPGKRLTFHWGTTGASKARIISGTTQRFFLWWDVPPDGTLTVELAHTNYRDPAMTLIAYNEDESKAVTEQVSQSITIAVH